MNTVLTSIKKILLYNSPFLTSFVAMSAEQSYIIFSQLRLGATCIFYKSLSGCSYMMLKEKYRIKFALISIILVSGLSYCLSLLVFDQIFCP